MQAVPTTPNPQNNFNRNLGYLLMPPLTVLVVGVLLIAVLLTSYQSRHNGRIFTGVTIANVDVSQLTPGEAQAALLNTLPINSAEITLIDPESGQTWAYTPAELGMSVDWEATTAAAFDVGRAGNPLNQMEEMLQSWYYGRSVSPIYVLNEATLESATRAVAADINQPATNANLALNSGDVDYVPGQLGRALDSSDLRQRLTTPLTNFQSAQIELLVHELEPTFVDSQEVSASIQRVFATPVSFYLQEPLDEMDLSSVQIPTDELAQWLRVEVVTDENGRSQHNAFIDEVALRQWLAPYASELYREPVNARFYFDDNTRELVLVAPHINGRELNIDATIARFQEQISTPNRSIPFVMTPIEPEVHANATAVELGITELITETTTWFYGSTDERKHNIARAAANFFGVVVAPGEEFSFNKYLGSISENDGYEQGFIIVGGQTVKGIGGGVCQVSTTLYQTAFNSGFPLTERWEHGYMLGYYNDGEGPGMDATVFSPIVDMKFINNTPYHLLIENYYSTENEALTFKFYSTSMGRTVEKERLDWTNIVPAPEEDRWEYNEELEPGTVQQVDWATEGATVSIIRTVYNADGVAIQENVITSNYIPVPNVYQYGPGVEPYDYSLVPDDH